MVLVSGYTVDEFMGSGSFGECVQYLNFALACLSSITSRLYCSDQTRPSPRILCSVVARLMPLIVWVRMLLLTTRVYAGRDPDGNRVALKLIDYERVAANPILVQQVQSFVCVYPLTDPLLYSGPHFTHVYHRWLIPLPNM